MTEKGAWTVPSRHLDVPPWLFALEAEASEPIRARVMRMLANTTLRVRRPKILRRRLHPARPW